MRVMRAIVVLVLCGIAACRTGRGDPPDTPTPPTTVSVENRGFYDMNVYAIQAGRRVRLGMAPGHQTTVLTIPNDMVIGSTDMQFLFHPIGPNDEPVTETIAVFPGDQVVLIVY